MDNTQQWQNKPSTTTRQGRSGIGQQDMARVIPALTSATEAIEFVRSIDSLPDSVHERIGSILTDLYNVKRKCSTYLNSSGTFSSGEFNNY